MSIILQLGFLRLLDLDICVNACYYCNRNCFIITSFSVTTNYVSVVDALHRLSMTRKQFLLSNPDCHLINKSSIHLSSSYLCSRSLSPSLSSSLSLSVGSSLSMMNPLITNDRDSLLTRPDKRSDHFIIELIELDEKRRCLLEPNSSIIML